MPNIINIVKNVFFVFIAIGLLSISCQSNVDKNLVEIKSNSEGEPKVQFDTMYHDFGTLIEGEQAAFTFKYKNTGTADLIIKDAYSTCGCTVPDYSKKPIKPGAYGKIEVLFNSSGKKGLQYKRVTLKLNTKIAEKNLSIKANVVTKN